MKKFIEKAICAISAITLIWVAASYVEIISKNLDENPEYSKGNIIVQLVEEAVKND